MAYGALSPSLLYEWTDMAERHPCQIRRRCPTYRPARYSAQTWSGNVEQWRPLVARYFRPGDVATAMRILACENTQGNPSAKNPRSSATGLFQHLARYWTARSAAAGVPGSSRTDPVANVIVAAWLRDQRGGWNHWTCYTG